MTHEPLKLVLEFLYIFLLLPFWVQHVRFMAVALAVSIVGTLLVVTSPLPVGAAVWGAMVVLALARRLLNVVVNRGTYWYTPIRGGAADPADEVIIIPHRALSLAADIVTVIVFGIVATLTVAVEMAVR